jgi:hypothetical protein
MTDFEQTVAGTIDDAVAWAGESTRQWLGSYARLVGHTAEGTATPDLVATELATLAAAGARDLARVSATWVAFGTAIAGIELPDPVVPPGGGNPGGTGGNPGGGGGNAGGGGGNSGGGPP